MISYTSEIHSINQNHFKTLNYFSHSFMYSSYENHELKKLLYLAKKMINNVGKARDNFKNISKQLKAEVIHLRQVELAISGFANPRKCRNFKFDWCFCQNF